MLRSRRSSGRLHVVWDDLDDFPATAEDYELLEEVGVGATARVWMAHCKPKDTKVAVKLTDLEKFQGNTALDQLIQEAHVMKGFRHPNLLPLHCSFIHGSDLWLVMPFIAGGSLANIISSRFPEGMEENMIATIAKDVLQGLQYLHNHDSMHRDLKAANMLVADDGRILLADFGACATLEREARLPSLESALSKDAVTPSESPSDSWSPLSPGLPNVPEESADSVVSWGVPTTPFSTRTCSATSSQWSKYLTRSTFIGTTAYMAPEVMDPREGYTQSADIWSFGICLLELARGRVPISECSFTRLVLQVVQNPAPTLRDHSGSHKFSQAMHEFVAKCLDKDAMARSGAGELLKHPFLRRARDERFLAQHLLGLGTLKPSRSAFHIRSGGGGSSPDSTQLQVTAQGAKSAVQATAAAAAKQGRTSFKALDAMRNAAVFQVVWTVYASGRKFYIVFHMTKAHSLAMLSINGVELLRRKYKLWQQLNFHADTYKAVVDSPQLPQLAGKPLEVTVHVGFAGMMGQAMLDGVVLDAPDCSSTYADISEPPPTLPALVADSPAPDASPFASAASKGDKSAPVPTRSMSANESQPFPENSGAGVPDSSGCPISQLPKEGTTTASPLMPAQSVPEPSTVENVPRALPQAISDDNLLSLDRSASEQMASALHRLVV